MQIETPPTEKRYDRPEGERRGLVIVNTGDGKGKSTAAFGLALRAFGRQHVHGKQVKIFQFMKVPTNARATAGKRPRQPSWMASTFWWCWTKSPIRSSTAGCR